MTPQLIDKTERDVGEIIFCQFLAINLVKYKLQVSIKNKYEYEYELTTSYRIPY